MNQVRRIVFASSVQAVEEALRDAEAPVGTLINRPSSLYGATKVMGETMGRWYHDRYDLEFIALRIGWFQPREVMQKHSDSILNI